MTAAAQWINETFASFDYAVLEFFHNLAQSAAGPFIDFFLKFITLLGEEGLFLIILSLILMFFKKTRKAGAGMLLGIIIGSIFTNLTIKPYVARPRPYASDVDVFKQWWEYVGARHESEFSFPSGHTTSAMAAMTGLFFTTNKKVSWTAFIFAILMGISRIYLCVHYPSDVLGGLIVGFVAGFLSALIIGLIYKNRDKHAINKIVEFDICDIFKKKKA